MDCYTRLVSNAMCYNDVIMISKTNLELVKTAIDYINYYSMHETTQCFFAEDPSFFKPNKTTNTVEFKTWSLFMILALAKYQHHLKNSFLTNDSSIPGLDAWCKRYNEVYEPLKLYDQAIKSVSKTCFELKCNYVLSLTDKKLGVETYDYVIRTVDNFEIGIIKRRPESHRDSYLYAVFRNSETDADYLPTDQLLYYVVATKNNDALNYMLSQMDTYETIKSLDSWFTNECTIEDCIQDAVDYQYANIEMLRNVPKLSNAEVITQFFNMQGKTVNLQLIDVMQSTGTSMFDVYDVFNAMHIECENCSDLPELG